MHGWKAQPRDRGLTNAGLSRHSAREMKRTIALFTARGAPPPRALARRLRASLGPQALFTARGAPPPRALARRLRASLGAQALLHQWLANARLLQCVIGRHGEQRSIRFGADDVLQFVDRFSAARIGVPGHDEHLQIRREPLL